MDYVKNIRKGDVAKGSNEPKCFIRHRTYINKWNKAVNIKVGN